MKIIPKKQTGGTFSKYFSTYTPVTVQQPSREQSTRQSSSEKGKLTEKDFFDMLKDINGLPNEMKTIVGNLLDTFRMSALTGIDTGDLATTYLSNLYQVRIATDNKEKYDSAVERATKNGAMTEPAISIRGNLFVQDQDGAIQEITLNQYLENEDQYKRRLLTVSNLANMRAYSPELAFNPKVFNIINNGVGFELFQTLIKQAAQSLGTSEYTRNGMFSVNGQASAGLELLSTLRNDDRVQAMGSVTAESLYKYKVIDKNQKEQINALTDYMLAVLPDNVKTWAAFRTGITNKEKATRDLIVKYLTAGKSESHLFDIDYQGSMSKVTGTKESTESDDGENPKEGYWVQVQRGMGGEDTIYNILNDRSLMQVNGKYYGTTPGMEINKSFNQYLADSGIRNIIKNMDNITFGDVTISSDSYNDIVIDANGGVMATTLPITPEGKVDFSIFDTYSELQNKLRNKGLIPNTPEYNSEMAEELINNGLDYLVDAQKGTIDISKFGHFLVFRGLTSSKAKAIQGRKKVDIDDVESNYIIDASNDDQLYDVIRQALSTKDVSYDIDPNNLLDWNGWDKVYSGNIFIPINQNTINGMNADDNDIKTSTAMQYELNMQQRQKANNQKSTDSSQL